MSSVDFVGGAIFIAFLLYGAFLLGVWVGQNDRE